MSSTAAAGCSVVYSTGTSQFPLDASTMAAAVGEGALAPAAGHFIHERFTAVCVPVMTGG
jgi:hypothetical protein